MLNRRIILAAALAAGCAVAAPAVAAENRAPPPLFSTADGDAAKAVVNRYFAAFTANDFAAFKDTLAEPFVTNYGRVETATTDAVTSNFQRLRTELGKGDYSASKAQEVRLRPLRASSALAEVHWRRFKRDGSMLNEGAEAFVLNKVDGQWKIAGNLAEDLRQMQAQK